MHAKPLRSSPPPSGRGCRSRPLALRAVLQQAVFARATGNGDLHAKNISVVGGAERTVAPIYDIPSTVPHSDPTYALPQRAVDAVIEEVLLATENVEAQRGAGAEG